MREGPKSQLQDIVGISGSHCHHPRQDPPWSRSSRPGRLLKGTCPPMCRKLGTKVQAGHVVAAAKMKAGKNHERMFGCLDRDVLVI